MPDNLANLFFYRPLATFCVHLPRDGLYGWRARRLLSRPTSAGWLNTPPSFKPSLGIQNPNGVSPGSNVVADSWSSGGGRFLPVRRSSVVFLKTYDQRVDFSA